MCLNRLINVYIYDIIEVQYNRGTKVDMQVTTPNPLFLLR